MAFTADEHKNASLSSDVEQRIDDFWNDDSVIGLIEFHEGIALRARALMRFAISQKWQLKALDAMHLASAQWLGADEFQTYDGKLRKFSSSIGCDICEPYVKQSRLPGT